ncbi:hypothetical protein LCGC14_0757560 [marine sediment metagenome]|uniref:Uncharacterized protein n=1 Tax=marine sediment metagenome TaxID=412755 RepID=A0A0F9Q6B4_9ZZZZ
MDWMLSSKERAKIALAPTLPEGITASEAIALAQYRKIREWLEGKCDKHKPAMTQNWRRHECRFCLAEFRQE